MEQETACGVREGRSEIGITTGRLVYRSLSDIAIRHEAKEGKADARPQAPKNWRRMHWNTVRIFRGREQSRCLAIIRRSRKVMADRLLG